MKTNSKQVRTLVYNHIADTFSDLDYEGCDTLQSKIKSQIDHMINKNESVYKACERLVEGGSFLISYEDAREFVNGLGLNNKHNKHFDDNQVWIIYKRLVAIVLEQIYNGWDIEK